MKGPTTFCSMYQVLLNQNRGLFVAIITLLIAAGAWYYYQPSPEQQLKSAETLLQQGEYPFAQQACEKAPDSPAKTRCLRIVSLMLEQHSVEQFYAEAEHEPDKAYALTIMGEAKIAQQDYANAAKYYNQAIQLNPNIAQPYFGIGQILHQQGRIRESLAWYEDAVERAPKNRHFLHNLAANFAERSQFDLAEEKYRTLLGMDDSQLLVYAELVKVLRKQGKTTEANALAQQAKQGLADNPSWKEEPLNEQVWFVPQEGEVVYLESWADKSQWLDDVFLGGD